MSKETLRPVRRAPSPRIKYHSFPKMVPLPGGQYADRLTSYGLAHGRDAGGYCAEHRRRLTYPEQRRGACSWCVPVDAEREPEYWASHWRRFNERR